MFSNVLSLLQTVLWKGPEEKKELGAYYVQSLKNMIRGALLKMSDGLPQVF